MEREQKNSDTDIRADTGAIFMKILHKWLYIDETGLFIERFYPWSQNKNVCKTIYDINQENEQVSDESYVIDRRT